MKQYYYTVASLPALKFDEAPSVSQDQFIEMCAVELTDEDMRYVRSAEIRIIGDAAAFRGVRHDDPDGILAEWNRMLREFQQQAALTRAQNLGWEADRLPRPDITDATIPERLRQFLNEDTPLKAEVSVARWLWNAAEALEPGHYFDRERLALYYIKLQIGLRKQRISDDEAGNEEFERQYNEVAQSLMEIAT